MKLLLDDKATRGHNLNANEACIFAAIHKCTRAGRGWYGNYRELAAAMPFVISHVSVYRAVQKLLNLGLIERREEKLFALLHNETEPLQNETTLLQNETTLLQNVLPPNNPPIINNIMNEKEKEQQRALCARDCDEQQAAVLEFYEFRKWFVIQCGVDRFEFYKRENAARLIWEDDSECSAVKRKEIIRLLKQRFEAGVDFDAFKPNPIFFLQDFPEPQPTFLSGLEQDELRKQGVALVQLKHDGRFLICTRQTMIDFGLGHEFVRTW